MKYLLEKDLRTVGVYVFHMKLTKFVIKARSMSSSLIKKRCSSVSGEIADADDFQFL